MLNWDLAFSTAQLRARAGGAQPQTV